MRLRYQLFAITALPLMIAFALGGVILQHMNGDIAEWRAAEQSEQAGSLVSALAHELQKERGYSVGFTASEGKVFAGALPRQRAETDMAFAAVKGALERLAVDHGEAVGEVTGRLAAIGEMRGKVDRGEIAVPEVAGFYTSTIRMALDLAAESMEDINIAMAQRLGVAYAALMDAKEAAGLERAVGSIGFGAGAFSAEIHERFKQLRETQQAKMSQAMGFVDGALAAEIQGAFDSAAVAQLNELRNVADQSVYLSNVNGVSAPDWFAASTAWVDELKRAEDAIDHAINTHVHAEIESLVAERATFLPVAAILVILCLAAPLLFSLRIERAVARVLASMRAITEDRLDEAPAAAKGKGEIADFARMAQVFHENALKRDAAVATATEAEAARAEMEKAMAAAREAQESEKRAEAARVAAEERRAEAEKARAEEEAEQLARQEAEEHRRREEEERRRATEAEAEDARKREEAKRAEAREQVVDLLSKALRSVADGDLSVQIDTYFSEEFKSLRMDFNDAVSKLRTLVGDVASGADDILKISDQVSAASNDLARRTEVQASTLEANAASVKTLNEQVSSSAREAETTRENAETAKKKVEESGEIMRAAVSAMDAIERSSEKISSIITVIEDITFQTNLLALNAGVEAARAGDAGRGFAVVASEVRALAQRAADSSQEIRMLIENSSAQIADGVQLVKKTGDTLEEVAARFVEISSAVSGLSQGATTQAKALGEVSEGVRQIDEATRENAAMAEETTAAAAELASQIRRVADDLAAFKTGDESAARRQAA